MTELSGTTELTHQAGPPRVAVLGRGLVPAGEPVLRGDDLGVLHGDGLFETMHLWDGRPWLVGEHLARLTRAASLLGLRLPPATALLDLLAAVTVDWPTGVEGSLRLVCTRGPEGVGPPTVYATLGEVPQPTRRARHLGIAVATLPLGVTADGRAGLDWLPAGFKSTSYALSSAARRWAVAHGVDDVLWVSTDGYALEGPTANLVWLEGDTLCTVPPTRTGILPGVTAAWLLAHAHELGFTSAERMISPGDLREADAAWLTSSVRGVAEIRTLDGIPGHRAFPSPHTRRLQQLLPHP
ncbi:aminotransferase class IV [Micromonospora inyonensis]|uniref:4-amino-4-deoxychorismate lyase n=1 Tax=Micromonospora inyonensis TaxID=47866 RepID=A0A1C6RB97_9ACTN|nr:aminotransferase class IV [Micromonospora inyonensis]SCL14411.1 4-amino-4-deoxychorismate lyase [Micromonospora inyonensis]